jgi:ribulose-phosphate 3-epimerase
MSVISPTITTEDAHEYREQMELIASYAEGVHIDFSDGVFAPTELLDPDHAWRSDDLVTHAHVMYQKPLTVIDDVIQLEADLVIVHAEADEVKQCLHVLQENGTRAGIALLPETSLSDLIELEVDGLFDHVLVFGGKLGFQGGDADLDQLDKVKAIRKEYGEIEISWDGGVNQDNAKQIAQAGVDILNVGSALHNANDPLKAYATLTSLVS